MSDFTLLCETETSDELGSASPHTILGRIVHLSPSGQPSVDFPGNVRGPLEARTLAEPPAGMSRDEVAVAEVLLAFESNDAKLPLIVGFPRSGFRSFAPPAEPSIKDIPPAEKLTVEVDGRRVDIQGDKEIRLSCGRSSITLRQDGKIVIKGTHIVSRSEGPHRIKGGSVTIN